jgi:DNA-binding response OmpR family regulator
MAGRKPRILSIGSYTAALDSRNRILEISGFEVVPSFRGENASNILAGQNFDCVVIGECNEAVRVELIRELRHGNATVPIVVVYSPGNKTGDLELVDAAIESLRGPQVLLGTLFHLIRKVPQFAVFEQQRTARSVN